MSQSPFQKFAAKKKNSVVKEEYRQEKKKVRAEKNAYFDNLKEEKYQAMLAKRALKAGGAAKIVTANAIPKKEGAAAKADPAQKTTDVVMPLNKFLAHCGVCSRRDAIALIAEGKVKVNAEIMTEPGYKVQPTDEVIYNTKKLFVTKNLVYILLNKPKDYITTTEDPQGRRTVLQLIQKATDERVYPIGRLDRNTSGVLLLTNDGDLTQKLSHPSYEIKKIYEVKLDKNLTKTDFDRILSGLTLEDGPIYVDSLAYADSKHRAEAVVARLVKLGLDAVIVNPAVVIGPGDHYQISGSMIVEFARRRLPAVPAGGMCVVDIDAVVRGHIAAAERGRTGERYILGGENLSHRAIAATICEVVGQTPPRWTIPGWAMPPAAAGIDVFNRINPNPPTLSGDQTRLSAARFFFDSSKAKRELAYPMLPFRGAVARAYAWYKTHGYIT